MIKPSQKMEFVVNKCNNAVELELVKGSRIAKEDLKSYREHYGRLGFLKNNLFDMIQSISEELKLNTYSDYAMFYNNIYNRININNLKMTPFMLDGFKYMDYFEKSSQEIISKYIDA